MRTEHAINILRNVTVLMPPPRWRETPEGTVCGNCGRFPCEGVSNWNSEFCPHCGMRMLKGESHGQT